MPDRPPGNPTPRSPDDSGPPLAFATDNDLVQELARRYNNVLLIYISDTPPKRPGDPTSLQNLVIRHAGDVTRTLGMFVRAGRYVHSALLPTESATFTRSDLTPPDGVG